MRLECLTYHDKVRGWKLEPMHFSDLTLLVGVSGAGKTNILKAIVSLINIAQGIPSNGIDWDVEFTVENGTKYRWSGEYESKEPPKLTDVNEQYASRIVNEQYTSRILRERLNRGEKTVFERTEGMLTFNGIDLPKLSPFESMLKLLNEEEFVSPATKGFQKIYFDARQTDLRGVTLHPPGLEKLFGMEMSIESIRSSNWPVEIKLALAQRKFPKLFLKIKESFMDIFPHVEDIKLEHIKMSGFIGIQTQIKETGVNRWIPEHEFADGMLKTIRYLAELHLWPAGSIILIDEFENSLGVNCLDVVTDELMQHGRDLQFILTSHHPYIINNIDMKHWKIVTRRGGTVTAHDASEFGLGKSKHEAFIQLINLKEFTEGITAA